MHNFVEKTNWNNNYGERESSKYIYIYIYTSTMTLAREADSARKTVN